MDSKHGGAHSKHLMSFKGSSRHLKSYDVNNGESSVLAQQASPRSSSASESSVPSSNVEKVDPADPLLTESNGPTFSADVSGQNPAGVSAQVLPSTATPQTQMMGHPGGYDPNRIPALIFSSKPTNPMEWSVASNESLFSIHVGNNSFSRDHVFLLYKSGEIPRLDDVSHFPPSENPVTEAENIKKQSENIQRNQEEKQEELAHTEKMKPESPVSFGKAGSDETEKNFNQEKMTPPSEEVRISSSSTQSFQFPVLDTAIGSNSSVKVVMEKQVSQKQLQQEPLQPQTPGTTPKAAGNSWFSCFSCCSFGC